MSYPFFYTLSKIVKVCLFGLVLLAVICPSLSSAAIQDTSLAQNVAKDASADSLKKFVNDTIHGPRKPFYSPSRTLELVGWPFKNLIQPALSFTFWPLYPPLKYIDDHEIVDRGIEMVTWGEDNNRMTFPVLNPFLGSGSYLGFRHIEKNIFDVPNSRVGLYARYFINGDYSSSIELMKSIDNWTINNRFSINAYYNRLVSTPFSNFKDTNATYSHSDSSLLYQGALTYALAKNWSISTGFGAKEWNFYTSYPIRISDSARPELQDLERRRFYNDYLETPLSLTLTRSTKESQYAALNGSRAYLTSTLGLVDGHENYVTLEGFVEDYHLLGTMDYDVSRAEDRQRLRNLSKFKVDEALPFLDLADWKKNFFERRVIVGYVHFRQLWDIDKNDPAVISSFSQMGETTPLRAWNDGTFLSYGYLSGGLEYRWPVIRRVDGVFFNEYGVFYNDPTKTQEWNLRNSWGFGVRIRNPDFYFLKLEIAFHGLNGLGIQISTAPEFN